MSHDSIINISLIGIVIALFGALFKKDKEEYGIIISIVGCFVIFSTGIPKLQIIIDAINKIQSYISVNESFIIILIKIIGISLISEIAVNICRDSKYNAVASQIELFAKLTILATGMPILLALLDTINNFLTS